MVSKNKRILKLPLRVWHDLPLGCVPAGTASASSLKLGSRALNETSTAKTIMLTNSGRPHRQPVCHEVSPALNAGLSFATPRSLLGDFCYQAITQVSERKTILIPGR